MFGYIARFMNGISISISIRIAGIKMAMREICGTNPAYSIRRAVFFGVRKKEATVS